jgi:hypothetical protein
MSRYRITLRRHLHISHGKEKLLFIRTNKTCEGSQEGKDKDVLSHVGVFIDGVWIGEQIY